MPVPYDYGVRFELDGQPGNPHEQVLVTAPDGDFIAVAVGDGFAEDRDRELSLKRANTQPLDPILREDRTSSRRWGSTRREPCSSPIPVIW